MNAPFRVPPTPQNSAFAATMNRRIRADADLLKSTRAFRYCLGAGALCALAGVGVGAVLFGYSYVVDSRTSVDKLTTAFADALAKTTLQVAPVSVTGSVPLDTRGATVTMSGTVPLVISGGTLSASAPDLGGRLLNSPGTAGETARGTAPEQATNGQQPSVGPLGAPTRTADNEKIESNYTIFHTVEYGSDRNVTTGWKYNSSRDSRPSFQYCYYSVADGAQQRVTDIARNGKPVPIPTASFDVEDARKKCVWFGGTT